MSKGPSLSEWTWAAVNLAFVVIAGVLFFSIDDPVLATLALAAALLTGEYTARRAAGWFGTRNNTDC